MKILLTGANGMVGRNIMEHPKASEFEILTPPRLELNLLDEQSVIRYLSKHQPDLIVHAAGRVGGIESNMNEPFQYFCDNILMGLHLIRAAYQTGVRRLMNLGSSCMYPRLAPSPLMEEYLLTGELEPTNEGYALSKNSVMRLCRYIRVENPSFLYKTIIPCNLYGRWDKFDPSRSHMVAAVIHKVHEAKKINAPEISVWGDGLARREFMNASDLADFILYAATRFDLMPDELNVGMGEDHSINEYYDWICETVGYKGRRTHDLTKPVGMKRKLMDVGKLQAFGWAPSISIKDGLQKAYQFYLDMKDGGQTDYR